MYKDKYELNVQINGKPIKEYYHEGKFYIEARENSEYSIKLKNHSHKRIMAIFSVDGIDVLKGGYAKDAESGYIVEPYSHVVINGYRIDDNNVATFRFDDGKTSYSTEVEYKFEPEKLKKVKQGLLAPSKNNGIIGVRVWEEKEPKLIPAWKEESCYNPKRNFYNRGTNYGGSSITGVALVGAAGANFFAYSGCLSSSPLSNYSNSVDYSSQSVGCDVNQFGELAPITSVDTESYKMSRKQRNRVTYTSNEVYSGPIAVAAAGIPNFSVGTSWGEKVEDKVIKVTFEKAETYIDLEIYYLIRVELAKLGIDFSNSKKVFVSGWPKAFDDKEDYCKKPINWRKP